MAVNVSRVGVCAHHKLAFLTLESAHVNTFAIVAQRVVNDCQIQEVISVGEKIGPPVRVMLGDVHLSHWCGSATSGRHAV